MASRNLVRGLEKYLQKSRLVLAEDVGWSEANRGYGIHKAAPLAVLKAGNWVDIQQSVKYCNQNKIGFAVKGGGVNQASTCVRKGALTLDLSQLKDISHEYNGKQLAIKLGAGINFKNLYEYLQRFNEKEKQGFITPLAWYSQISCIGAFSILGNGLTHRKVGFGVDLIRQAKVLLSSSEIITANQEENSDVLWAIRGCGPHIGAILQMTIKMDNCTFNCFKTGDRDTVKTHLYSIPFNQSIIGFQNDFLNFLLSLDPRFLCYFGFGGNHQQSNIYLLLSELLTNNLPLASRYNQSQQGKQLKAFVGRYNGKNIYHDKQYIISDLGSLTLPKPKEKYYKIWGFYTTSSRFRETLLAIFQFYLKNPINCSDKEATFSFSVNYFGCEVFSKRDQAKTSMPGSKQETFLIYGNISYLDQNAERQVKEYLQRFQKCLQGKMPLGSPCDFDQQIARNNPHIGKWIYRQNYERLKAIKLRMDPLNCFNYGLFN